MKLSIGVFVLLALAIPSLAQTGQTAPPQSVPPKPTQNEPQAGDTIATFKSDVKLVNVFATVTDQNGAPIATLKQGDFKISEDGIPQKIAVFSRESELPLSIVMAEKIAWLRAWARDRTVRAD